MKKIMNALEYLLELGGNKERYLFFGNFRNRTVDQSC